MPSFLGWMSLGGFFVPALGTHCCALTPVPTLSSSLVLLHLGQAVQLPDPAENHPICPSHHPSFSNFLVLHIPLASSSL